MKCIYTLWTGGWDSTFRLVELSLQEVTVQPVYCVTKRNSIQNEIKAMNEILALIKKKPLTKAIIKDVEFVDVEKIPLNAEITEAYNRICQNVKLGSQYEWLSRLATKYPMIEIGVEKPSGEYSGIVTAIEKDGAFICNEGTFIVDKNVSSNDINLVFGQISFPIVNRTERDMLDIIKKLNYEDVMSLIWFCHEPINGKACGFCRPCQQKMECDMKWLLPNVAQKRYRVFNFIRKIVGGRITNKIMRKIYRK